MNKMNQLTSVAAAVLALSATGLAHAGETIDFGDDLKLDWRLTTSYGNSSRVKDASPTIAGSAGANDGDNNFSKGSTTSSRLSALVETTLRKGASGFVLSGSTFYDEAYQRSNSNKAAANNPNKVNKAAPFNQFTDEAISAHGGYGRVLDAYGYTAFGLGDESRATVRLGRHVVNWGESSFFPNIAMAQGPFDGTKTGIPGTEVKDSVLPEDQLSASIEVNSRLTLLMQAQYGFHPTIAPAPGSYLNSSDGVGPGGNCLGPYSTIAAIPAAGFGGFSGCSFGKRGADITPSDSGQWGLGTRFRATEQTEVGVYYLNYSDRTPLPEINAITPGTAIPVALRPAFGGITQIGNGSYRVRYFDNIKMIGATVSSVLGSVAVTGELTFKQGAPVLVNTLVNPAAPASASSYIPNPTRADITQLNLGAFANIGRTPIAESVQVLGEISAIQISNVSSRQAPGTEAFPAAFGFKAGNALSFQSDNALAFSGVVILGYPGIFEGWDLSVPISYSQQISGRTLVGGVGGEGDQRYGVGATFTYNGNFSVGVSYLGFLGDPSLDLKTNRLLTDRDQLSVSMKYAF
jgi:hypothetical protein